MMTSKSIRVSLHIAGACLLTACLALSASSSAVAAPSPWYEVVTGSRPTNLWEPTDNVQELKAEIGESGFGPGAAARIDLGGKAVGCLGTAGSPGELFCEAFYGFPVAETASQLEAVLEGTLGPAVEVTGGPVGGAPFKVTVPKSGAPQITLFQNPEFTLGSFSAEVLSSGGSGRLVVTVTNLGDAALDATKKPFTITDELPEGVEATGVEGVAGVNGSAGPFECEVEAVDLVSCVFEEKLPPFESFEVEIPARLIGEPPVEGALGKVTISGGNGATEVTTQEISVSPAKTPFGIEHFASRLEEEGGDAADRAGRHPFQLSTTIQFNAGQFEQGPSRAESGVEQPAQPRNIRFSLPVGFVGNVATLPTCSMSAFYERVGSAEANTCSDATVVGAVSALINLKGAVGFARPAVPVFNLPPASGEPARFGFAISKAAVVINTEVDPDDKYRIIASVRDATQLPQILSSTISIWGSPGDARHDNARGWGCIYHASNAGPCQRPLALGEDAFLRLPVSCVTPVSLEVDAEPWNVPPRSVVAHKSVSQPMMTACNQVPFSPEVSASPTSQSAGSPSGLNVQLNMPNAGLLDSSAVAEGQAKKVEIALPEGVSLNPSQAERLVACSPSDLARETPSSLPGEGCPEASKVGSIQVTTPLLAEEAKGSLYVATPYDNPFGTLVALYMIAKIPDRGILIKQAGKVRLNPTTGRIVSTFDELPQLPFDTFKVHLSEGNKAPLVMPARCGSYDIVTRFTPWSASDPDNPLPSEVVTKTSTFTVDHGVNGGPCPSGPEPFKPEFKAGVVNSSAGSYSPFNIRLTRQDGEQEFSRFSVKLPKGVIGKLAGIPFCPDAAIAAAKARTSHNGGQEELDNPSCPAASQIGSTLVGAGVGPELSYAPGRVYLAGPYQGAKLSIAAIATAKVGPFDLGTVVIRQALRINPETAEVTSDGNSSDPIPHILQGVVVHARDIRVSIDRDKFVLNPTNCEPTSATANVLSVGGLSADASAPFQAVNCLNLGFRPKLSIQLLGGTRRTATPRLKAIVTARKGDANIGRAQVTLPRSEFLEQAHIRTVCTRVQFNAGGGNGEQCPKGSVYGKAKAVSPLLDEPLKGPVFLRSSNHELPDMVAALHSRKVDINVVGRIDSVNGGIRSTFETVPDAPVSKFILEMQGGKKGLIVNSINICKGKHRAIAAFTGQNGRVHNFNPVVKTQCGGKKSGKGGRGK
jgi:hypothetical protein